MSKALPESIKTAIDALVFAAQRHGYRLATDAARLSGETVKAERSANRSREELEAQIEGELRKRSEASLEMLNRR